ncbi:integrase core domain-containing protein, partial [Pseudomonas aeruginosa]
GNKISNPPWVKFQSAGWVNFPSAPTHWFCSLAEARIRIAAWRRDYNAHRPHSAIGNPTPAEFAASWRTRQQQLKQEKLISTPGPTN